MVVKNQNSRYSCNSTPLLGSGSIAIATFFVFHSIFSGIVWMDKHDCDERICFPKNGCNGNRKPFPLLLQQLL